MGASSDDELLEDPNGAAEDLASNGATALLDGDWEIGANRFVGLTVFSGSSVVGGSAPCQGSNVTEDPQPSCSASPRADPATCYFIRFPTRLFICLA